MPIRRQRWSHGRPAAAWPDCRESRQLEILTQLFSNRLLDAMRERAGASYAPQVSSQWPTDLAEGGTIRAFAQLKPEDVPTFFAVANEIAADLAANPPSADELARVTEPLRQLVTRASTGNGFWLYTVEGATADPRRLRYVRSLLTDYSQTTPAAMQALAKRYLAARPGVQVAVIPEGQVLPNRVGAIRDRQRCAPICVSRRTFRKRRAYIAAPPRRLRGAIRMDPTVARTGLPIAGKRTRRGICPITSIRPPCARRKHTLANYPPLVFAGEARALKARSGRGRGRAMRSCCKAAIARKASPNSTPTISATRSASFCRWQSY